MITREILNCDLRQIYDSGQCFRWQPQTDGGFVIPAMGRRLHVAQQGNTFSFDCTREEFEQVWWDYFDLSTDYGAIVQKVDPGDAYLTAAVQYGAGLRILRQNVWEMIVTFLLSQNSNIPRIRKNVQDLCALVGGEIPTPQQLAVLDEATLRALGVGYRAKYLLGAGSFFTAYDPQQLRNLPYEEAHRVLRDCPGIGPKVADCICLFGLHHVDAFPVDTHIRQILSAHYPDGFPLERYQGCAGILQQYMFYYDLQK